MSNSVVVAGDYRKKQSYTIADGRTPKPGTLMKVDSDGKITDVHTAGDPDERMVLIEDALQSKTTDDAYAAGDVADCGIFLTGSESLGLVASGETIVIGDKLVVSAAGKFIKATDVATQTVMAVALEAADLSSSVAVDTLIKVRYV